MPENNTTTAATAQEQPAVADQRRGDIVTDNYDGPDRRLRPAVAAPEPKHWYQTVANNIGQWLAIGGVLITAITMYSDFKTKSAVRDALIDERFAQHAQRAERAEESARQSEVRRISEKQEFTNQINGVISEIRTDIRLIRERLDRGR
ncbi:MAG: hypothetical protein ACRCWJ_06515 [Casimicrobium sp.]